jgi:hypothetical protein
MEGVDERAIYSGYREYLLFYTSREPSRMRVPLLQRRTLTMKHQGTGSGAQKSALLTHHRKRYFRSSPGRNDIPANFVEDGFRVGPHGFIA